MFLFENVIDWYDWCIYKIPRKLISRNYHHIASNPDLVALFPRENLIGGTKRDRNLGEMLSPTDH